MDFRIFCIEANRIELIRFYLCKSIGVIARCSLRIRSLCERTLGNNLQQGTFLTLLQLCLEIFGGCQGINQSLCLSLSGHKLNLFKFRCPGIENALLQSRIRKFLAHRNREILISRIFRCDTEGIFLCRVLQVNGSLRSSVSHTAGNDCLCPSRNRLSDCICCKPGSKCLLVAILGAQLHCRIQRPEVCLKDNSRYSVHDPSGSVSALFLDIEIGARTYLCFS